MESGMKDVGMGTNGSMMKTASMAMLGCALASALVACSTTNEPPVDPYSTLPSGAFSPSWSDEFDGTAVDASKWYVIDRHEKWWPETPWRRNYKAANVSIAEVPGAEGKALVIRTVKDGEGFSTGALQTKDNDKSALFQQAYGRFEARVKFPTKAGHWCAFWLMSDRVGEVNGNGQDGTEIDIMEKSRLSDWINHALHWDGYGADHKSEGHDVKGMGLNDGGWHTFRVDWYPDRYVFYVDGTETWRTAAGGVSRTPNYILLTEEIGNFGTGAEAWGGGPIDAATLPDFFYVDWVRVSSWVPAAD
jgi:beta-glucanase (GH16 family)